MAQVSSGCNQRKGTQLQRKALGRFSEHTKATQRLRSASTQTNPGARMAAPCLNKVASLT